MAKAGKLDPVIGRADEMRRMIDVLCRRTKNSAVLLGEAGAQGAEGALVGEADGLRRVGWVSSRGLVQTYEVSADPSLFCRASSPTYPRKAPKPPSPPPHPPPPGVGKTAIVEGLAQRIAQDDVPEGLRGCRLIALEMGLLMAGAAFPGEFEERLRGVLKELQQEGLKWVLVLVVACWWGCADCRRGGVVELGLSGL